MTTKPPTAKRYRLFVPEPRENQDDYLHPICSLFAFKSGKDGFSGSLPPGVTLSGRFILLPVKSEDAAAE